MEMTAGAINGKQWPRHHPLPYTNVPRIPRTIFWNMGCLSRGFSKDSTLVLKKSPTSLYPSHLPSFTDGFPIRSRRRLHVLSPDVSSASFAVNMLEAWDDEYGGVIVDPNSLPSSANAFASSLQASLSNWKLKGKRGIWLKIHLEQADLVPIAIQEGFKYHHAEPGYVMLTYWIPDEPCMLPGSPSHQIGVGGFVINDKKEVYYCIVFITKPVETAFLKMVAFRHAHLVAFEKSDILFVCMLRPLTYEITIDEKEIQAAKWMPLSEFIRQPFYEEDHLSKRVIDACIAAYEDHCSGFIAHQLTSKLDHGKLSYLYYDNTNNS
ncbi:hypothetical protein Tsubulata_019811 [Turnera subulata]|uniref:Pre-nudix hydrolase domain-containing protein n=1 Tax=Turnera subulata TaxID=218843 RepID=A0A9Q0FJT6_9ROSI|nr:hypothetical protein Tsubulata_019811 [Turnera subulata]